MRDNRQIYKERERNKGEDEMRRACSTNGDEEE
jgi:hypothetical protein